MVKDLVSVLMVNYNRGNYNRGEYKKCFGTDV